MTVKIISLKTGQFLISEIDERPDEDADCILINPKRILGFAPEWKLENFIPFTYQKQIPIRSSDILTIVDPMDSLLTVYRVATA
jgi:hypothetical protein